MAEAKTISVKFEGNNQDLEKVTKALNDLAKNINPSNLEILGKKSYKLGINTKITMFQNAL